MNGKKRTAMCSSAITSPCPTRDENERQKIYDKPASLNDMFTWHKGERTTKIGADAGGWENKNCSKMNCSAICCCEKNVQK